jgi:hypothetical protein
LRFLLPLDAGMSGFLLIKKLHPLVNVAFDFVSVAGITVQPGVLVAGPALSSRATFIADLLKQKSM